MYSRIMGTGTSIPRPGSELRKYCKYCYRGAEADAIILFANSRRRVLDLLRMHTILSILACWMFKI